MTAAVVTVNDVLDGHVRLDIECLDRIYLNVYVPKLQTSAQVVAFLSNHLGFPFPSPALFNQMGQRFRRAVTSYADANDIPWIKFGKGDDKLMVMCPHLAKRAATGISGVAAIGVAQEFQRVWTAYERTNPSGTTSWWFTKADRRVTCYYFYLWDDDFGCGLSRCAPTSRIRPRFGSTGMSGPNARPPKPVSRSPHYPTGSPTATIRKRCKTFATGSEQAPSTYSRNAG